MNRFRQLGCSASAVFLPVVGAIVMLRDPAGRRSRPQVDRPAHRAGRRWRSASTAHANFDYDQAGRAAVRVDKPWIPLINSRYLVGLDGISLPLFAADVLIVPLCIIYSWNHFPEPGNPRRSSSSSWSSRPGMVGTFLAQDLILFFVFFEVVLLPMYFMIGVWGGEQRQYASIKFFLYTLFGSALMIVSFLALYFCPDRCVDGVDVHTFDMRRCRPSAASRHGALVDLRRHVHRLRHQGADLPVPHVAARRPHPGADGRLGDPGRRAPEAGHVRLHPHRPADPARRRPQLGAVDRRCWPSSASSTARSAASRRPT